MAFAEWAQNNEVSFNSVWFSDDAHFYVDGVDNKPMCDFERHVIHEKVHHAPRITVWVAVSRHGLLESFFLKRQWAVNAI
jgi:hypothetical protein